MDSPCFLVTGEPQLAGRGFSQPGNRHSLGLRTVEPFLQVLAPAARGGAEQGWRLGLWGRGQLLRPCV